MRLQKVERGHRWPQRLILWLMRLTTGHPPEDVVRMLFYRPELAGKHLRACLQEAMRGPSEWTVGERELMAAFVSQKNQCPF